MKQILTIIFFSVILFSQSTNAQVYNENYNQYQKKTFKEIKEIDSMLNERLNLSEEQKEYIKNNRQKHKKEIEDSIDKMKELQIKIRNIYLTGIPKWQADLRTAGYKTELAIIKQNIDKMKADNRKNFENILNDAQKIEFEKIKKEFSTSKAHVNSQI